ncbi:MAG TPA: permease [Campylobacterales bacterium]|nr:permease [Campylobacterales bacterium]
MKKSFQFKGLKFLYVVIIAYVVLFFIENDKALLSLQKSLGILYQLLPIFLFIIIVSALINYFLKPKQIIKHFGKDSGAKGVVYAILAGIISHGPMYAWYGMIQELREQGAKDSLLIMFFYARAIKIPMLPFMLNIFGLAFTLIISLYIVLFAFIQGQIMEWLESKK